MTPDWHLPASWLAEDANMRQAARDLRAEADHFRRAYLQAIDTGQDASTVRALKLSMWSAIEQAAKIERQVRGIDHA